MFSFFQVPASSHCCRHMLRNHWRSLSQSEAINRRLLSQTGFVGETADALLYALVPVQHWELVPSSLLDFTYSPSTCCLNSLPMSRLNLWAPAVIMDELKPVKRFANGGLSCESRVFRFGLKSPLNITVISRCFRLLGRRRLSLFLGTFQMVGLTPSSRTMFVQRCWLIFRPSSEPQRCWRPPQRRLHGLGVGLASVSIK